VPGRAVVSDLRVAAHSIKCSSVALASGLPPAAHLRGDDRAARAIFRRQP
jgi:hypothetical protein